MTPRFLTVLNGLSKSKSHLKEKVTPVFNTSYTLPHLPTCLAEFSNYAELCTFEYTWSTAEEDTSSPDSKTVTHSWVHLMQDMRSQP